jgi:hypothetical protein
MKSDNDIAQDLKDIDQQTVDVVCDLLRQYSTKTSMYLANMVASVCDVDVDEMLTDTKHLQNSHARWFFWFAYRYMTNENYDSIARKTGTKRKFTVGSIGYCISKMSMMVESEPIWVKRWTIIKRVIKAILDNGGDNIGARQETLTFKVQPPKGIDVKLQVIK